MPRITVIDIIEADDIRSFTVQNGQTDAHVSMEYVVRWNLVDQDDEEDVDHQETKVATLDLPKDDPRINAIAGQVLAYIRSIEA